MSVKIPARPGPRQDAGFFGPGSMTWEIQSHPMVLLAGLANGAIYTALSSEVSQSVVDHSKQFTDPYARLQETSYWVIASSFADRAEATRAGHWLKGVHKPVKGPDPVSNTEYSPHRADLALAGHCLIFDGNIRIFQAYGRKLSDAEIDQYWQEGLVAARLMGIDTETPVSFNGSTPVPFPQTYAEWLPIYDAYIAPRLNLSAAARKIIDSTGSAFFVPWWGRPLFKVGYWSVLEATVAVMDPNARAIFGRPRGTWRAASTVVAGRLLGRGLALPPVRNTIESSLFGSRSHELLSEARELRRKDHGRSGASHPETAAA
jgi:uncharacterized protein (DUF2236 family)